MAFLKKDKEPSLEELLEQTSRMSKTLMQDIYKDFYSDGAKRSGDSDSEGKSNGTAKDGVKVNGSSNPGNNPTSGAPAGKSDGTQAAETAAAESETAPEDQKSGKEQLEELIGLGNIKHDVEELTSLMKIQKMREEKGMRSVPTSLHLVFAGNPGTGKTTVARILAQLYKEIGVLSKGQLVEVDRSGLVAGYVGQTAIKTQEKIEEAMGGILFIDEAYTLAKEGNDFGQEAIDTILKAMEDHRKDFIVIVAGYTRPMMKFIESNPGLKSRFNKYLYFEDYTAEELTKIFKMQCEKYSYHMSDEVNEKIGELIREIEENKDENFANAREVRNLFEEIITNQARRVAKIEEPTDEELTEILAEDLDDDGGNALCESDDNPEAGNVLCKSVDNSEAGNALCESVENPETGNVPCESVVNPDEDSNVDGSDE